MKSPRDKLEICVGLWIRCRKWMAKILSTYLYRCTIKQISQLFCILLFNRCNIRSDQHLRNRLKDLMMLSYLPKWLSENGYNLINLNKNHIYYKIIFKKKKKSKKQKTNKKNHNESRKDLVISDFSCGIWWRWTVLEK